MIYSLNLTERELLLATAALRIASLDIAKYSLELEALAQRLETLREGAQNRSLTS